MHSSSSRAAASARCDSTFPFVAVLRLATQRFCEDRVRVFRVGDGDLRSDSPHQAPPPPFPQAACATARGSAITGSPTAGSAGS